VVVKGVANDDGKFAAPVEELGSDNSLWPPSSSCCCCCSPPPAPVGLIRFNDDILDTAKSACNPQISQSTLNEHPKRTVTNHLANKIKSQTTRHSQAFANTVGSLGKTLVCLRTHLTILYLSFTTLLLHISICLLQITTYCKKSYTYLYYSLWLMSVFTMMSEILLGTFRVKWKCMVIRRNEVNESKVW
jgi:hypothetical protein